MTARALIRTATILGAFAVIAAVSVPSVGADTGATRATDIKDHAYIKQLYLRSPDTTDAAAQTHPTPVGDLRSPDTTDAAAQTHPTPVGDLRSPDTIDAAGAASIAVITGRSVSPGGVSGFDWTDAAIAAASGFVLALALVGTVLLVRRSNGRRLAV